MIAPWRPLPELNEENAYFWKSGADGHLRFLHCRPCDYFIHPPSPVCPQCLEFTPKPNVVSGKATVRSVPINYLPWGSGLPTPYAIAIVGLDEQDDLNLTTNVVGTEPHAVRRGDRVKVVFEGHGVTHVPLFEPAAAR